jgi:hypothetical protein
LYDAPPKGSDSPLAALGTAKLLKLKLETETVQANKIGVAEATPT